jgi:hypothetical protein
MKIFPNGKLKNKNIINGAANKIAISIIYKSPILKAIKEIANSKNNAVNPNKPFIPSIKFIPFITTRIEKVKKMMLTG